MLQLGLATVASLLAEATGASPGYFSVSEWRRWTGLTSSVQRQRFVAARYLLRRLLQQRFGGQLHDWQLQAEAGQPPCVQGQTDLFLSLSHSGDYLCAAISDQPVGVDVERSRPGRSLLAMAEVVCHPHERELLHALADDARAQRFLQQWTRKEAWLKRQGLGLDWALMARLHLQAAPEVDTLSWQCGELSFSLVGSHASDVDLACHWPAGLTPERVALGRMQLDD